LQYAANVFVRLFQWEADEHHGRLPHDATRRTTFARGGNSAAAERSALLQPKRSQPSGDTKEQLHPTRPFIPADLVQNTAEYLGRVAGLLPFRGVSTEWQGAMSFLNGRCWNRLECHGHERRSPVGFDELWVRLRLDDAGTVARCAVLCLRSRLEAVMCG
jgi:hypothetical protein